MRGWQLILMNPVVIAFDFKDVDQFEGMLSKSQESHCSFLYFTNAEMDLVQKLQFIYEEDASHLRNVSKANYGFSLNSWTKIS